MEGWGERKKVIHVFEASHGTILNPMIGHIFCIIFTVWALRSQNNLTVMVSENIRCSPIKYYLSIFFAFWM